MRWEKRRRAAAVQDAARDTMILEIMAHFDTNTNDGRANLPVCQNLTASQRSDADGTMRIRRKNIAPLVLGEVWAARQRPPYLGTTLHPRNKNGAGFWPAPLPQLLQSVFYTS